MKPERWRRIDELFRTVADRPVDEREAYLKAACGDDEELRREVLELLAHSASESFLHDPIKQAALAVTKDPTDELLGQRIGPYRLIRSIARGGMGTVYEAVRDDDEFHQKVALKLIKRGMDTDFVRERFLRERQILASLDHPYIARLFDGGTTSDGLPYFVMEFVDGQPITEYNLTQQLPLNQKLKLFRAVCSAVQHAHQKLVVHRDLKPSNILVTADGTPKLLDFGIAKLLARDPGEAVTRTETALRLMTPDYASPEQVRGEVITTATDVYSLGVVLYELLAERKPYEFETYAPLAIERAICETQAPRPSDVARQQTNAPTKLARQLTGDLDNIVLMAMRKEPERRYQSVEQFSEDLRRYLSGLPIAARPDTFMYRTTKFVRRHRVAVVAAALIVLSLLGGIVATTSAARQARVERERAERRFAQVRKLSNTFLFDVHDKIQNVPGTTEARALVAQTARDYLDSLAVETADDSELEWELAMAYQKVGDAQGNPWAPNLGVPQEAMQSYRKSLALAQRLRSKGSDDPKMSRLLVQNYFKFGMLQARSGGLMASSGTLLQMVAAAEKLAQQTHEPDDLALLKNCYTFLGDTYLDTGDPVNGLASYRKEMELAERQVAEFGGDASQLDLASSYSRMAEALVSLGELDNALDHFRRTLALIDQILPGHLQDTRYLRTRMDTLIELGNLYANPRYPNQGDARMALQHYRAALTMTEQAVARDSKNALAQRDLATVHQSVAEILITQKSPQVAQAVAHFDQALAIIRSLKERDSKDAQLLRREATTLKGLAIAQSRAGDLTRALQNLRLSLSLGQDLLQRDLANTRNRGLLHSIVLVLAEVELQLRDYSAASAHYLEALTLAQTPSVEKSSDLYVYWRLAESYTGLSRYHAAMAVAAPVSERFDHWHNARKYAQQSLSLWQEWSQHRTSSSFDRQQREHSTHQLAICEAALAKLSRTVTR